MKIPGKLIPGFDGFYAVDTKGQVWSCRKTGPGVDRKGSWKKRTGNGYTHGYPVIHLTLNGREKEYRIHTLVLTTFIGPRPFGKEACHEDDNPKNNALKNLRWGTKSENIKDGKRNGCYPRGEKNPSAKLTWEEVSEIRRLHAEDKFSAVRLAAIFKVSSPTIDSIVKGQKWRTK